MLFDNELIDKAMNSIKEEVLKDLSESISKKNRGIESKNIQELYSKIE